MRASRERWSRALALSVVLHGSGLVGFGLWQALRPTLAAPRALLARASPRVAEPSRRHVPALDPALEPPRAVTSDPLDEPPEVVERDLPYEPSRVPAAESLPAWLASDEAALFVSVPLASLDPHAVDEAVSEQAAEPLPAPIGETLVLGEREPALEPPVPLETPRPRYPPLAVRRGIEGVVVLGIEVGADGAVAAVSVVSSSGSELLDQAALEAARGWRFVPGRRDGAPAAMHVLHRVRFVLTTR